MLYMDRHIRTKYIHTSMFACTDIYYLDLCRERERENENEEEEYKYKRQLKC